MENFDREELNAILKKMWELDERRKNGITPLTEEEIDYYDRNMILMINYYDSNSRYWRARIGRMGVYSK